MCRPLKLLKLKKTPRSYDHTDISILKPLTCERITLKQELWPEFGHPDRTSSCLVSLFSILSSTHVGKQLRTPRNSKMSVLGDCHSHWRQHPPLIGDLYAWSVSHPTRPEVLKVNKQPQVNICLIPIICRPM